MSENDYNFILNNDRIPTYDNPTTNDDWPTIRELFPQWNAQNIQSFAQVKKRSAGIGSVLDRTVTGYLLVPD